MDLVNSNSCSFALRRSFCDVNMSETENMRQFGFSKLVDDLMTKRNKLSKFCSTSTSNGLDGMNNSKVVTVDLESEQEEKMDLQNDNGFDLKEIVLTLEKEVEKRFDSLNVEFRMQLVEAKEMNVALKEQILRIREESVPLKQYTDLKESYEKKISDLGIDQKFNLENFHSSQFSSSIINNHHQDVEVEKKVFPMNSLEHIKTAHKMEMDELKEKLEKECEKRLSELRVRLEKENQLKLDQLRTELAQCLVFSMDKEVQTDDEINLDVSLLKNQNNNSQKSSEIMDSANHQSINRNSTLIVNNEVQTDNTTLFGEELMNVQSDNFSNLSEIIENQSILLRDSLFSDSHKRPLSEGSCSREVASRSSVDLNSESPVRKRKRLSIHFANPHLHDSTPKPSSSSREANSNSYPSVFKNLIKSNDGFKIPSTHLAVRMCTRCRWVERIMAHDYSRHFKTKHSSVDLGEETMLSQFKSVIIEKTAYTMLKDPKTRSSSGDSTIEANFIHIPARFIFVQFCSICRWMETVRRGSYQKHFKDYHSSSEEEEPAPSQCELIVMKMTRFKLLRNKWLQNSKRKESSQDHIPELESYIRLS